MTDDKKRQFDMIFALRSAAWNSFDKRRDFEWRAALSLWTAMAAMIGIILSGKDIKIGPAIKVGGAILVAILAFLHAWFTHGIQEANRFDRDLADHYDDFVERDFLVPECQLLIDPEWNKLKERRARRRGTNLLTNYSHRFQVTSDLTVWPLSNWSAALKVGDFRACSRFAK
jgi:hypothetical protein